MIFNDIDVGVSKILVNKNYLEVTSKDNNIKFYLSFNDKMDKVNIKDNINISDFVYFDATLIVGNNKCVFDISDFEIMIKEIDNNLYHLEICIVKPYIMFFRPNDVFTFNSLVINTNFSFID